VKINSLLNWGLKQDISTGNYFATQANITEQNPFSQQQQIDDALHKLVSTNLNYSHKADTNRASQTVLLNGLNLNTTEFLLLYDSTPYASKGHIALNLPCDSNSPNNPLFQVLVGRAPDLVPTTLGYLGQISEPPQMCVSWSVWFWQTCYRCSFEEYIR
jgi:hypothetical protein